MGFNSCAVNSKIFQVQKTQVFLYFKSRWTSGMWKKVDEKGLLKRWSFLWFAAAWAALLLCRSLFVWTYRSIQSAFNSQSVYREVSFVKPFSSSKCFKSIPLWNKIKWADLFNQKIFFGHNENWRKIFLPSDPLLIFEEQCIFLAFFWGKKWNFSASSSHLYAELTCELHVL